MSDPAALRLVDPDTGEVHDHPATCKNCARLEDEIAGLQRDIRGWAARYRDLERDKAKAARANKLWPTAINLFRYWQEQCKHPRSGWTADRFWLVEPFLRKHGEDLCRRAIDGAAFDPWKKRQRNGAVRRFDSWELIHRDQGSWESFVNRAPPGSSCGRCTS